MSYLPRSCFCEEAKPNVSLCHHVNLRKEHAGNEISLNIRSKLERNYDTKKMLNLISKHLYCSNLSNKALLNYSITVK